MSTPTRDLSNELANLSVQSRGDEAPDNTPAKGNPAKGQRGQRLDPKKLDVQRLKEKLKKLVAKRLQDSVKRRKSKRDKKISQNRGLSSKLGQPKIW